METKGIKWAILTEDGKEIIDPLPLFQAVTPRPLTIKEQIQRLMKVELSRQAGEAGMETIEEANDFDVEDEFDSDEPLGNYVLMEDELPVSAPETTVSGDETSTTEPEAEALEKDDKKEDTV